LGKTIFKHAPNWAEWYLTLIIHRQQLLSFRLGSQIKQKRQSTCLI
jgi:hypothetical protein